MTIQDSQTVGELAARSLAVTRIFEDHGIDFCCGGSKPLAEVCREKQLDPAAVIAEIEAAGATPETQRDWTVAPLDALIDHIVRSHHGYLRQEFPRLTSWLGAVQRAHGERDGALLGELGQVYGALREELELHMHKEEAILFPAIRRQEGWIGGPIAVMEHEHVIAGNALAALRRITGGYRPPEHACNTYRALFAGLEALEKDLHLHIHLENNILFPRAMADTERGRGC